MASISTKELWCKGAIGVASGNVTINISFSRGSLILIFKLTSVEAFKSCQKDVEQFSETSKTLYASGNTTARCTVIVVWLCNCCFLVLFSSLVLVPVKSVCCFFLLRGAMPFLRHWLDGYVIRRWAKRFKKPVARAIFDKEKNNCKFWTQFWSQERWKFFGRSVGRSVYQSLRWELPHHLPHTGQTL